MIAERDHVDRLSVRRVSELMQRVQFGLSEFFEGNQAAQFFCVRAMGIVGENVLERFEADQRRRFPGRAQRILPAKVG